LGFEQPESGAIFFDGKAVEGYEGDTIASALFASGWRTFSRSFKYHRPRGEMCACGQCTNSLVAVDGRGHLELDVALRPPGGVRAGAVLEHLVGAAQQRVDPSLRGVARSRIPVQEGGVGMQGSGRRAESERFNRSDPIATARFRCYGNL